MDLAFFTADGDALEPTRLARSMWSDDQMHGVAVAGALARSLERAVHRAGREELRPVRLTVDMFRAASMSPCRFQTQVVREGPRICLVDAVLDQGDGPVARASAVFLLPTAAPGGRVWRSADRPVPPPEQLVPVSEEPRVPNFRSDAEWSDDFAEHQNAGRKSTWQSAMPVVAGERPSPFQAAAGISDSTSLVTNWGDRGVEYINTDITLTLARPPASLEIGLEAVDHVEADGIAIGTATVFDRQGVLGTSVVTALANAERQVDFEKVEFADDGSRRRTR